MDALDRLLTPARDLLSRVDGALVAAGAPAGAPIWPLLRKVGALPGDALEFAAALAPDPLARAAAELHVRADAYAHLAEPVDAGAWEGPAAEAFSAHWRRLRDHLDGPGESLAGQLRGTAAHLRALAGWAEDLRADLAHAIATALGSAEAVALHLADGADPGSPGTEAAAAIGYRVLAPVAEALDAGHDLLGGPAPWADELPYRPASSPAGTSSRPTRVPL